jgi:hypothetical protein
MTVVNCSRLFLTTMHRLALIAALLMVVAPLISRWLQWQPETTMPLCTDAARASTEVQMLGDASSHAGHHADAAQRPASPAAAEHAMHEYACDYCLLAARMLPWLALAVLLWWLPRCRRVFAAAIYPVVATPPWPAHAARGPPVHA